MKVGSVTSWPTTTLPLVAAILLLSACDAASTTSPAETVAAATTAPPPTLGSGRPHLAATAKDAVAGYLHELNAHDAAAARSYLAPEYQQRRDHAIPPFDGWVANIVSVRLQSMPAGIPQSGMPGGYSGYRDLIEFGVTFDAVFRTESDFATSGPQTRFFTVGRNRTHNAWLILDIGTQISGSQGAGAR